MSHAPRDDASIDALRRRLDRGVAVSRALRWLGWLGRVACITWAAAAAIAVVQSVTGAASEPVAGIVWSLAVVAALLAWWFAAGRPPRRLDVAAAAEAAHPELGERLSRAIDFLDAASEDDESRGLKALAIADAARAVEACGKLPVAGLDRHARWLAAGSAAVIGMAILYAQPSAPVSTVDHEAASPIAVTAPPSADVTAAATAIAAAAAVEARLTAILETRFTESPGTSRDDLPAAAQAELDRLASLHADAIREIDRGRDAVAAIVAIAPAARAAADLLAGIDRVALARATAAISLNRLSSAATITSQAAEMLSAAARGLGAAPDESGFATTAVSAAAPPPVRRLALALDDIAGHPGGESMAPESEAAEERPSEATPGDVLPTEARGPTRPDRVTTEPRFTTDGEAASRDGLEQAAGPVSRAWALLPARARPTDGRGGEPEVPAAYRQAVDLYYKSLLESLRPR